MYFSQKFLREENIYDIFYLDGFLNILSDGKKNIKCELGTFDIVEHSKNCYLHRMKIGDIYIKDIVVNGTIWSIDTNIYPETKTNKTNMDQYGKQYLNPVSDFIDSNIDFFIIYILDSNISMKELKLYYGEELFKKSIFIRWFSPVGFIENHYYCVFANESEKCNKIDYFSPLIDYENEIYDVFYVNETIYIIKPGINPLLNIKNDQGELFYCIHYPDNYVHLYYLQMSLKNELKLTINNIDVKYKEVNKYPSLKNKLVISTMVKNEDNYIIQWIEFHKNLGVECFIIYDNVSSVNPDNDSYKELNHNDIRKNEHFSNLKSVLRKYILKNEVILINWPFEYASKSKPIKAQMLQMNHAIKAFQDAKYIGFFDIDEYLNPQNFNKIEDVLEKTLDDNNLTYDELGSFVIENKWFYNPNSIYPEDGFKFLSNNISDNITEHFLGHSKTIVNPRNVEFQNVHKSTLSSKEIIISNKNMYFNHYCYLNKTRGRKDENNRNIYDSTISNHFSFLKKSGNIVMYLNGGLGNQLFQIASGFIIAKIQNKNFFVKNVLKNPHSNIDYFQNIFRKIKIKNDANYDIFYEPDYMFTNYQNIPYFVSDKILHGFFQNEKYFFEYRAEIISLFEIIEESSKKLLLEKYKELNQGVFIHFRRNDYVGRNEYDIISDSYYKRALSLFDNVSCMFYVFSDDIPYCRELPYLKELPNVTFVNENELDSLYLMSMCYIGGIGTNSSFSWWGGWLNENVSKQVVYPFNWYGDKTCLDIWWKNSIKVTDEPRKTFLTFGAGENVLKARHLANKMKDKKIFHDHVSFLENDLKNDILFWNKHSFFIYSFPHSFGCEIWKPYILKHALDNCNNDETVFYCDNHIDVDDLNIERLLKTKTIYADYIQNDDVHYEIETVKRDLFEYFKISQNDPILYTRPLSSRIIVLKKSLIIEKFVDEWLNIALNNHHFLNDFPSYKKNFPSFKKHYTSSLFSLLAKKHNIIDTSV